MKHFLIADNLKVIFLHIAKHYMIFSSVVDLLP